MLQFLAHGEVSSLTEVREVMAASFSPETYEPADSEVWQEAYENYQSLNQIIR